VYDWATQTRDAAMTAVEQLKAWHDQDTNKLQAARDAETAANNLRIDTRGKEGHKVTERGQDIVAATAKAGQSVTMRGQNMLDARQREATEVTDQAARGKPFEAIDPATNQLTLYQLDANGNPVKAKNVAPKPKEDKALTEDQGKATSWHERMKEAEAVISKAPVSAQTSTGSFRGAAQAAIESIPFVGTSAMGKTAGNLVSNEGRQKVIQAQEMWVAGLLRSDTGAAYKDMEKDDIIRTFFPVPNDPVSVREQKKAAREGIRKAMAVRAGPGLKKLDSMPITVEPNDGFSVVRR
jgi:hypothetical protein